MMTLAELTHACRLRLNAPHLVQKDEVLRHLIQGILDYNSFEFFCQKNDAVAPTMVDCCLAGVERLNRGEPLAYVLGWIPFLDWRFAIDARAFVPRPETEYLMAQVRDDLKKEKRHPKRVLDLCCGSGVMGLSLALSFPEAEVVLAEQSEAAAALAYENAQGFGLTSRVKVFVSDLFSALKDEAPFDLLVCNPPYVAFEDQESGVLEANVAAFEPHLALFSDDRGMGHVKRILKQWPAHAAKGALAVFELGFRHHSELSSFLSSEVEGTFCWVEDLSGIPRFLWLRHS